MKVEKKNCTIDIYIVLSNMPWLELDKASIMKELEQNLMYGIFLSKLLNTLQVE